VSFSFLKRLFKRKRPSLIVGGQPEVWFSVVKIARIKLMKSQKTFFVLLVLFFSFLPLLSSAQFVPFGPPCTLDPIPAVRTDGVGSICSYCPSYGSTTPLHLSWDIKGEFKDPVCGLNCWGPSGNQCYNFSPNQLLDGNKKVRSNDLKPKDDVFLLNPPLSSTAAGAGTNMQVWCWEKSSPSTTKKSAGIRVVSECQGVAGGEPCEIPFDRISPLLDTRAWDEYSFTKVEITENSLADWVNDIGELDKGSLLGSGNRTDIENYIISQQNNKGTPKTSVTISCPVGRNVYFNSQIIYSGEVESEFFSQNLKTFVNDYGYPVGVTIRNKNWPVFVYTGGIYGSKGYLSELNHQVIVLSLENEESGSNQNYSFSLQILDPNEPTKVTYLKNCRRAMLSIESSGFEKMFFGGFGCTSDNEFLGEVFVYGKDYYFTTPKLSWIEGYHKYRTSLCSPGSSQEKTNFCKRGKINEWLKNNLTNLDNPGAGGGNCYSWTIFMLKVAYFGDFVGIDYHPNDGNITGTNCDPITHYPVGAKRTSSANSFLASAWSAWRGIFK
jgi:hypothetical protein